MDNSQSSDVFSGSQQHYYMPSTCMDEESYKLLISKIKNLLSKNVQTESSKPTFPDYFSSIVEDCNTCLMQSLDFIAALLGDEDTQLDKLCEYMEESICLLQMLSSFLNNAIQSVSLTCKMMKTFPICTGHIILNVFTHCKDSELTYGNNLRYVEKQLKELFRRCHELQLTYLVILEKHFIFDLSDVEQKDILIETMQMNISIGEVVQTLDIKTMAEQWKAFALICEKFSNCLSDANVCSNCTTSLSMMIDKNIEAAFKADPEDKVVLRSLKVTNFTIKILMKLLNTFKEGNIDVERIVDTLLKLYAFSQKKMNEKSQFAIHLMQHIVLPCNALLKEVLRNETFVTRIIQQDFDILNNVLLLGYALLIADTIKSITENGCRISKRSVLDSVFRIASKLYKLDLNLKLNIQAESKKPVLLDEYILIHIIALCATMDLSEFNYLEQYLYKALLGSDCVVGLFASTVWVLMAGLFSPQLLHSHLVLLCGTYKQLHQRTLFHTTPQATHLRHTIRGLFSTMDHHNKMRIYKQFNVDEESNVTLWYCLQVKQLPQDLKVSTEWGLYERTLKKLDNFEKGGSDINGLIDLMKTLSTCSFDAEITDVEDLLLRLWAKLCRSKISTNKLEKGNLWFIQYVETLAEFTMSVKELFCNTAYVVKVLHITSMLSNMKIPELDYNIVQLLSKLSNCRDENKDHVEVLLNDTITNIINNNDNFVINKLFNVMSQNIYLRNITINLFKGKVKEKWMNYEEKEFKITADQLHLNSKFIHKCLEESVHVTPLGDNTKVSSNFEMDIDSLFDDEPANKKAKINTEVDEVLARLDKEVVELCKVRENVFSNEQKCRIREVCNKLKNIIN